MMKKRLTAIILVLVLAAVSFVGCGNSTPASQAPAASASSQPAPESAQPAVTSETAVADADSAAGEESNLIMFWWGNQTRNERTQQVLEMFMAENPGITIDGQFADGSEYWTRLATLAAGRTMPDVVQMEYTFLSQYARNSQLADLQGYVDSGAIDLSDTSEQIVQTGIVDGALYGICNGVTSFAMMYNKTLLDGAGIAVKDNMNLDEFRALCKEVYAKTGYKTALTYGSGKSPDYLLFLLRAHGKKLYGDGAFEATDASEFNEFFALFEDGINEGWHVDPSVYVERQQASVEQDCLVYGSSPENMSWCAFYASNQITAMQNAAPEGVEIAMTTFPSANPVISNFLSPSQFFSISVDSPQAEAGAKLINYLTNSVECNNVLLGERGVPISQVVAKAIAPNLDATAQRAVTFINDVITPNSTTIDPPAPATASQIRDMIDKLTEQVLYGEMTASAASEQLFNEGNAILAAG
ncbi:MAG: extracellular solute-binding protein [Clostridiales bacterium]|nr:extracellular solute-binding protein [Clostridiales bacterium]